MYYLTMYSAIGMVTEILLNHILILNRKRKHKPPVRRVAIPRTTIEPEEELIPKEVIPDKDPPERRKNPHYMEELEILHHRCCRTYI